MNANFGLFPRLEAKIKKKQERYEAYANRALESIMNYIEC
jgi:methylenetetrahydrofolate--tRNA-(uracil-5-)-methyltransferase